MRWPAIPRRRPEPIAPEAPRFWLLWNPCSNKPPRVKFTTQEHAERIAERMADEWRQPVYVLEAKSKFERVESPIKKTVLG